MSNDLDRIILALDKALEEAQAFAHGSHGDFRERVKKCRDLHNLLAATLAIGPERGTVEMRAFLDSTRAALWDLELLAGTSSARH